MHGKAAGAAAAGAGAALPGRGAVSSFYTHRATSSPGQTVDTVWPELKTETAKAVDRC